MDYQDYYAALGVGKKASQDEIQKAFRKLARKHHPDISKSSESENRFKEINEAYEVLKDPDKRARYDQFGSAWKQAQRTGSPPPGFEEIFSQFGFGGPGGFGGGGTRVEFDIRDLGNMGAGGGAGRGDFSSFFEALFGSPAAGRPRTSGGWPGFGGQASQSAQPAGRGLDREARIAISLEEAGRGGKKEITLGDHGGGKKRRLRVNLPKGIRPGQKIRLAGQGGKGPRGNRGDLYLTVDLLPHPSFRLEGPDLHTRLAVAPWEAALGSTAAIQTLDGEVTVRIPPGSSSGRRIRLRGRGFPAGEGVNGDLLAEIRVMVPEELSENDRRLFEELAATSDFEPRPGQAREKG